ncbi:hypothetical protein [Mycobacterium decipiens]|nr:hypothetical protein [Mycobacterium decipiens]
MVESIERQLDSAPEADDTGLARVYAVVKCFNLGALLAAMFGRTDLARRLCETEIGWLERMACAGNNRGVIAYAFQPWVNLARLDRVEGHYDRAVERLDVLRREWQTKSATIGAASLAPGDWDQLLTQVEVLPQFLRYNWTHENLLCALRDGAYDRIDEIASALDGYECELHLRHMLDEAHLIVDRLVGKAGSTVADVYWQHATEPPLAAVRDVRLAELNLARGGAELVDTAILDLTARRLLGSTVRPWELAVLQHIVALMWQLDERLAMHWAASAYDASRIVGDEVFEAWFVAVCAEGSGRLPVWQKRADELARRSWHRAVRLGDHHDHDARCATIDRVSSRLLDIGSHHPAARATRRNSPGNHPGPRPRVGGNDVDPPTMVHGVRTNTGDRRRATATVRFASRRILPLGPVVDEHTPDVVRWRIESFDFADQPTFAAKPYAYAIKSATPVSLYVLARMTSACRQIFGVDFDENQLMVTVRVDEKDRYTQRQGAHIDWCAGTTFNESEWQSPPPHRPDPGSFLWLGGCHSIDCVLGGPPTEFFLDEQDGVVRLQQDSGGDWKIAAIDFLSLGTAQPGMTGQIVYRPPYTVHQFPPVERWRGANRQRLFISFDYRVRASRRD